MSHYQCTKIYDKQQNAQIYDKHINLCARVGRGGLAGGTHVELTLGGMKRPIDE